MLHRQPVLLCPLSLLGWAFYVAYLLHQCVVHERRAHVSHQLIAAALYMHDVQISKEGGGSGRRRRREPLALGRVLASCVRVTAEIPAENNNSTPPLRHSTPHVE